MHPADPRLPEAQPPERPPRPSREGLEDHQLWVWIHDHWEIRGTGLNVEEER